MTKGFDEQEPCECGLTLAEAIVAGPHRQYLGLLRDHQPNPWGPGDHAPVVYFAEIGDLIKIGTSARLVKRMNTLHGVLLGTVPGSFTEERAMHRRFAHLRVHGEYFRPDAELKAFIDAHTQIPEFFLEPPSPRPPVPQAIVRRMQQDIIPR